MAEREMTLDEYVNCLHQKHSARKQLTDLREDLERERMRLAVCGVVAMSNTPATAKRNRAIRLDYWSASASDVASAVDREMKYRSDLERLRPLLDAVREFKNAPRQEHLLVRLNEEEGAACELMFKALSDYEGGGE